MKNYGLGIDAGGTYTDIVVLDLNNKKIIFTTKEPTEQIKPIKAISKGLAKIDVKILNDVRIISLATTFATNAIVENRGGKAGLILVGYGNLPHNILDDITILSVDGGHTVSGMEKNPLDIEAIKLQINDFVEGLDAVAVAAFFSVRNPDHELRLAKFIMDNFHLPVVCSHAFSMKLDFFKRASTALWNARLIPLITNLIKATEEVLLQYSIKAPFMVVKGDGTLMSAKTALERPVETILSGPAASIMGAKFISGLENALVVDMGGTTTDMAIVKDGHVNINEDGVRVGEWKTHVMAAEVITIGVGGDSLISKLNNSKITVGPLRAIPLCVIANKYPQVIDMLKRVLKNINRNKILHINPTSFTLFPSESSQNSLLLLPHSDYLEMLEQNRYVDSVEMESIELNNGVYQSSLTPTDIRVFEKDLSIGNPEAAKLGVEIFSNYLGIKDIELIEAVDLEISRKICLAIIELLYKNKTAIDAFSGMINYLFNSNQINEDKSYLNLQIKLSLPVVGLGAPAPQYLDKVLKWFNGNCYYYDAYDVSVALGAIVGTVETNSFAKIRLSEPGRYTLHTELGIETFENMEEAIERGKDILKGILEQKMRNEKINDYIVDYQVDKKTVPAGHGKIIDLESDLRVRAIGKINSFLS